MRKCEMSGMFRITDGHDIAGRGIGLPVTSLLLVIKQFTACPVTIVDE